MFVDAINLTLRAGRGGNGVVAWRREKYIPKGGPAGGDGGHGGSIIIQSDHRLFSLENYRHKKIISAERGKDGQGSNKKGKNGQDFILKVPVGTLLKDSDTNEIICDFTKNDESYVLCRGGKGGKGNIHFKSPTNQAPNIATNGTLGQEKNIFFELKLIADVGLIGIPNAGKSTLLSQLTKAKIKIGAYPFTTLQPNIGLLEFSDFSRIFIADIPGIIEHAHLNKGLGLYFLKHIERTSVLIFVIDIAATEERDPYSDFLTLQQELKNYNPKLLDKPFLIALNKMDIDGAEEQKKLFEQKVLKNLKDKIFAFSAKNKTDLSPFIEAIKTLSQEKGKRFF